MSAVPDRQVRRNVAQNPNTRQRPQRSDPPFIASAGLDEFHHQPENQLSLRAAIGEVARLSMSWRFSHRRDAS